MAALRRSFLGGEEIDERETLRTRPEGEFSSERMDNEPVLKVFISDGVNIALLDMPIMVKIRIHVFRPRFLENDV